MANFIRVNSANRHAARRLLTRYFPSAEVRHWPNGRLGLELHNAINAGKLAQAEVLAALAAGEFVDSPEADAEPLPQPPVETVDQPDAPQVTEEETMKRHEQLCKELNKELNKQKAADKAQNALHAMAEAIAAMEKENAEKDQQPEPEPPLDADKKYLFPLNPTDEFTLRDIIRDEHSRIEHDTATTAGPALITIRTESATRTVSGRKHAQFETLLRVISTRVDGNRRHAWVTGPMGSGKSTLNRQVAEAAGLDFYSCGSIASKYELIGFIPANGDTKAQTLRTPLRNAYERGGVFSFDDVDGSEPKALTAFLGALDGQKNYMFPDGMVDRHPDFACIASANTWGTGATAEYVGRNKVDAAFLSRFAARLMVDYDEQLERDLVGEAGSKWAVYVQALRKVVTRLGLKIPVTPRHTIDGHALMAGGMDHDLVKDLTVYAGIDKDTKLKLKKAVVDLVKTQKRDTARELLAVA